MNEVVLQLVMCHQGGDREEDGRMIVRLRGCRVCYMVMA